MLSRALVVVMTVLLLQPPGYCLCRLTAAPARRPAGEARDAPRKACPCCRRPDSAREAPARVEAPLLQTEHHPGCPVGPTAAVGLDPGAQLTPLHPTCTSLTALSLPTPSPTMGLPVDALSTRPPARGLPLRC